MNKQRDLEEWSLKPSKMEGLSQILNRWAAKQIVTTTCNREQSGTVDRGLR
jgi:hypothetical protein